MSSFVLSLREKVKVVSTSPHDDGCVVSVTDSSGSRQDNIGTEPECADEVEAR